MSKSFGPEELALAADWDRAFFKVWELSVFLFDKYMVCGSILKEDPILLMLVCLLVATKVLSAYIV